MAGVEGGGEEVSDPMDANVVEVDLVEARVEEWVKEIQEIGIEEEEMEDFGEAWDDAHGGELPIAGVQNARPEDVGFMQSRNI